MHGCAVWRDGVALRWCGGTAPRIGAMRAITPVRPRTLTAAGPHGALVHGVSRRRRTHDGLARRASPCGACPRCIGPVPRAVRVGRRGDVRRARVPWWPRHRGGTMSQATWATHGGCCKTRPTAVFEAYSPESIVTGNRFDQWHIFEVPVLESSARASGNLATSLVRWSSVQSSRHASRA